MERHFSGHAYRLTQDVERLRRKAKEAFQGPRVAEPTPDDRKQERRCLGALHSEAHRFLQFLNELKPLVDEDDDAVTAAEQVKAILGVCLAGSSTQAKPQDAAPDLQDKPKRSRRRRRKTDAAPRPLTAKQTEAVHIVGECKGNFTEAAARMGLDAATVRQHYNAGMAKLGGKAVKHGTQRLPSDRRGQDNVILGR